MTNGYSRRSFLRSSAALAAWSLLPTPNWGAVLKSPKFTAYPFACGIASGDPTSSGVVLWTRLASDPLNGGGMPNDDIAVSWMIADDEQMTKVVQKGTVVASPNLAHSVHVEAEGLRPDRWYFYQFKVGNETSPVGRTRTAPAPGAMPDRLRFAFASCQHYETGLYTAYEHMAKAPLDLVVHLGDYIYDGAARDRQVRRHTEEDIVTLEGCRNRHAQYKTDEHLQATHAAFPWLVTWDDHEVDNNYAGEISQDSDVSACRATRPTSAGLPGVLRAHAAATFGLAARARHAALPPSLVRRPRELLRARHTAVPDRSALRRRQQASVRGRIRFKCDFAGRPTREMALRRSSRLKGDLERARPAGDVCAGRSASRRRGRAQHGSVAGLRGQSPATAVVLR